MEFIFLNAAGQTLFVRDDMESGHWTQEQMSLSADFPFDPDKLIADGQRIAFRDPATDVIQVFEINVVKNHEPEHYQEISAEHICIAELSDEHINNTKISGKTAAQALTTALTGTLWSVGNNTASGTQDADFSRGSVWDAVNLIQKNWNVYITPRITISSAGVITHRYLDIAPAEGVWRGLRLSFRKNMIDPCVTYDESEVYTAFYGYGGNVDVPHATGDDTTEELTFADVVWTATSSHPAKPAGQTYLEWPEKTALYGRNGRPRYGYYQNGDIDDAGLLLEKTWESLKNSSSPKISISGTCVDLYRLGYADQPIRLHDLAIVEIEETGEAFQLQVIRNDVDLVDPTGTRPEIGDYIPNIIYINRDTNEKASGGGGGGGHGKTNDENEDLLYYTEFIKTQEQIGMVIRRKNGDDYIVAGNICLAINESLETGAYINADHVNISATQTAHMLAGSIVYDQNGNLVLKESSGAGVLVERSGTSATFGIWDKGNLTGGVMVQQINGQSSVKISGNVIDIAGVITAINNETGTHLVINADNVLINGSTSITELLTGVAEINILDVADLYVEQVAADDVNTDTLTVDGDAATWQSQVVVTDITAAGPGNLTYALTSNGTSVTGSINQRVITSVTPTTATIHYLGSANT